jgi:hypothetical protein
LALVELQRGDELPRKRLELTLNRVAGVLASVVDSIDGCARLQREPEL